MTRRKTVLIGFALSFVLLSAHARRAANQVPMPQTLQSPARIVRLAEIEVEPAHLTAYRAALAEEIEASIRLEPGVLTLFAVAIKGQPTHIRLFETYASPAAYQAHLASAHFLKYKAATHGMIKLLTLLETDPIALGMQKP